MGVGKVRVTENTYPADGRLFSDPYASNFVIGGPLMEWMGAEFIIKKFDEAMPGMYAMLAGRTRWLDDFVREAAASGEFEQLIILGAG